MAVVISDISPEDLLRSFRGPITEARPAYPETIQLQLTDADGGRWWFVTWDAEYTPSDPDELAGKVVVHTDFDMASGGLTIVFSDGSRFKAAPRPQEIEASDDPEYWQLFAPDGSILNWGPCQKWSFRRP